MSEIYPIDDLDYENNSLGNGIREGAYVRVEGTRITAREMVLTQDPTRPDSYVLVFTGQVKLVYDPPK